MKLKRYLFILSLLTTIHCNASEKPTIRLAVLAYGTANWELSVLKNQNRLDSADYKLEIQRVASPQAGKIALQSGAVDMIISDWIWVSRMRSTGSDFSFYPYSATSGALVVPDNSSIQSIADLVDKKLGIAGGELDKNWLLLQALAKKQYQLDLNKSLTKVFAAPPLLNQQILHGRIDAIINYWHYAAKLEAKGYQQIINGQQILQGLGIAEQVPPLGYVFNRAWAIHHQASINQFLNDTQAAKNQLCESNAAWQKIIPLTRAKDTATQKKLRQRYCQGRIQQWSKKQQQAAARIYQLLHELSHNRLTGKSATLQANTFWNIN